MFKSSIQKQLSFMKVQSDDFEWYPTTDEIINCVRDDMKSIFLYEFRTSIDEARLSSVSILDCGAGDGRALEKLSFGGQKLAIEKSKTLLSALPRDVVIVGTDFLTEPLFNKSARVTFCNPPYSQYEDWMCKIISESRSNVLYFVVPKRWKKSNEVRKCLISRSVVFENPRVQSLMDEGEIASLKVIGEFDFSEADRSAPNAKVDVIRVVLASRRGRLIVDSDKESLAVDPRNLAINSLIKSLTPDVKKEKVTPAELAEKEEQKFKWLLSGGNPVESLVASYNEDREKIFGLISSICSLDTSLLSSLGVDNIKIKESASQKISELAPTYWRKLLRFYEPIKKRVFSSYVNYIEEMVSIENKLEFTESNIYAITEWVIKNSNSFIDEQVLEFFDKLSAPDNIKNYKSNAKVFDGTGWRAEKTSFGYRQDQWQKEYGSHVALEYRLIVEGSGSKLNTESSGNLGLTESASSFLSDILVLARNLGFDVESGDTHLNQGCWEHGKPKCMSYFDGAEKKVLVEAKFFKKGTLHLRFDMDFIMSLNVEVGRLKGWVRSPKEASEEMGISESFAESCFGKLSVSAKIDPKKSSVIYISQL